MSNLPPGKLSVTVVEARDLKNKDGLFGKNDAFVKLKLDKSKEKTLVIKNAGSKATWNETFNFKVPAGKADLRVECMDYDRFTSNDLIGEVYIPINAIRQHCNIESWYPIAEDGRYSGEVHLRLRFTE